MAIWVDTEVDSAGEIVEEVLEVGEEVEVPSVLEAQDGMEVIEADMGGVQAEEIGEAVEVTPAIHCGHMGVIRFYYNNSNRFIMTK